MALGIRAIVQRIALQILFERSISQWIDLSVANTEVLEWIYSSSSIKRTIVRSI
jgi:hypothetical protein